MNEPYRFRLTLGQCILVFLVASLFSAFTALLATRFGWLGAIGGGAFTVVVVFYFTVFINVWTARKREP